MDYGYKMDELQEKVKKLVKNVGIGGRLIDVSAERKWVCVCGYGL